MIPNIPIPPHHDANSTAIDSKDSKFDFISLRVAVGRSSGEFVHVAGVLVREQQRCPRGNNSCHRSQESSLPNRLRGQMGAGHPPPLYDPNQHVFDHFYGYVNMLHAHNFYPSFLVHNGKKEVLGNTQIEAFRENPPNKEGRGVTVEKIEYAPELITQKALWFIRENHEDPFFLYFALNIPHANNKGGLYERGMEVPEHGEFTSKPWCRPEKGFVTMIKRIDDDVGRILSLFQTLEIDDDTLIFFLAITARIRKGVLYGVFRFQWGSSRDEARLL